MGVSGERERSECAMREKRVSGKSVGRERGVSVQWERIE